MRDGVVVVTGASRGIGAAIARALAEAGFRVAGLSRSGMSAAGDGHACDIGDESAIRDTIARIAGAAPLLGLVNNAGQHEEAASDTLSAAAFERLLHLNATSVVVACREAHPHLKAAGGGLIVNIGSFFDRLGVPRNVAYCASKAAVGAITRCLAVEWAADNIRAVNIAPGYIATDLNREFMATESAQRWIERRIPAGRGGTPEEVGRLVALLFAADIPFLTGETIYLDGGQGIKH